MEICNIGINEGGQYICQASNGMDVVTNTTMLTVLESGGQYECLWGVRCYSVVVIIIVTVCVCGGGGEYVCK